MAFGTVIAARAGPHEIGSGTLAPWNQPHGMPQLGLGGSVALEGVDGAVVVGEQQRVVSAAPRHHDHVAEAAAGQVEPVLLVLLVDGAAARPGRAARDL